MPRTLHAELTRTVKAQRATVIVEPIHADLAPVLAYVDHITRLKGTPHHAVIIPAGSTAHGMGFRFVSIPGDELAHYLANGAELAAGLVASKPGPAPEVRTFICTHQSGAHAVVEAQDGPEAIDTFRRKYVQPVGNVTARLETLAEASARERSVRGSRYLSFATQSAAKE